MTYIKLLLRMIYVGQDLLRKEGVTKEEIIEFIKSL